MKKAVKIHKNRIFSTIVLTIFLMILVSFISFMSIVSTTMTSFARDCSNFDNLVEKISTILVQGIEQKGKTLIHYGDLLKAGNHWSKTSITHTLHALAEEETEFIALGFIENDGKLISPKPNIISTSEIDAIGSAFSEKNLDFYVMPTQGDSMIYAIPLSTSGIPTGILIGIADANLNLSSYGPEFSHKKSALYLLTPENKVMAFSGGDKKHFNYNALSANQFFSKSDDFSTQAEILLGNIESQAPTQLQGYDETLGQINHFIQLLEGTTQLWYQAPTTLNQNPNWKLVVSVPAALSPASKLTILNVALLVAFVITTFFFTMLFIIISQGISNYKLSLMAYRDFETGHYNWNRFEIEVGKALKRIRTLPYAMVTLDIRKFRVITDLGGYHNSDLLLKAVSDILKKNIRRKEFFTRVSVDEFALLLISDDPLSFKGRLMTLDTQLKKSTFTKHLSFSYGIYYLDDYKMSVHRIYNYSCMAKTSVKKSHTLNIGTFTDTLRDGILREKTLENNMELALAQKEFHVYFQPKYSSDGKFIAGAEALVRWISPTLGFISPGHFIPLFENNGFIIQLDNYMLDAVCSYQKKWLDQGVALVTISVNLSRLHLLDPHLVEHITTIVDHYDLPHHCIELELTESAFFDDKDILLHTVKSLRDSGFSVSMDDFGAGYSSLNSLKDLPLDVIKLDGEFFKETENKERSQTVIQDTITLARHLNMKIVAEGIETKEQVDFLEALGCDLIQGFYFARPMPATDFENLMGYIPAE